PLRGGDAGVRLALARPARRLAAGLRRPGGGGLPLALPRRGGVLRLCPGRLRRGASPPRTPAPGALRRPRVGGRGGGGWGGGDGPAVGRVRRRGEQDGAVADVRFRGVEV